MGKDLCGAEALGNEEDSGGGDYDARGRGGGSDYDARTRGVTVELGKERQGCGRAEHLGCVWLLDKV